MRKNAHKAVIELATAPCYIIRLKSSAGAADLNMLNGHVAVRDVVLQLVRGRDVVVDVGHALAVAGRVAEHDGAERAAAALVRLQESNLRGVRPQAQ